MDLLNSEILSAKPDSVPNNKVEVVQNNLLGDFNKANYYIINERIIEELVLLKKVETKIQNNSIFCEAMYEGIGLLTFEIAFKHNKTTKVSVAELYLLEKVNKVNGYYNNVLKTLISTYSNSASDAFKVKALLVFNVTDKNDIDGKDDMYEINDINADYINSRKALNKLINKSTEKDYDKIYEAFFNKRLLMLRTLKNNYSKDVLNVFNEEYSKVERYFVVDKKGKIKYKSLNELLDKAFEDVRLNKVLNKDDKESFIQFLKEENNYNVKMTPFVEDLTTLVVKKENATLNKTLKTLTQEEKKLLAEIKDKQGSLEKDKLIKQILDKESIIIPEKVYTDSQKKIEAIIENKGANKIKETQEKSAEKVDASMLGKAVNAPKQSFDKPSELTKKDQEIVKSKLEKSKSFENEVVSTSKMKMGKIESKDNFSSILNAVKVDPVYIDPVKVELVKNQRDVIMNSDNDTFKLEDTGKEL